MTFWEIINSPIVLTIISLIWGSLVASWVTALWQKRSHQYEVKLQYAQDIVNAYQKYVRMLRSTSERLSDNDFDELHSRIVSYSRIAKFLFREKKVGENWIEVVDKLANIRNLRMQGRDFLLVDKKLKELYPEANVTIENMFSELV
jgi:hypothetical protein